MKSRKRMLFLTFVMGLSAISLTSLADIKIEVNKKNRKKQIDVTFTGKKIQTYQYIKAALKDARVTYKSKCFQKPTIGNFGEPTSFPVCVLRLAKDTEATLVKGRVVFLNKAVTNALRTRIRASSSRRDVVKTGIRRYSTGATGGSSSASGGARVRTRLQFRVLAEENTNHPSLYCSNEKYDALDLSAIKGCVIDDKDIIAFSGSNRTATDAPTCNITGSIGFIGSWRPGGNRYLDQEVEAYVLSQSFLAGGESILNIRPVAQTSRNRGNPNYYYARTKDSHFYDEQITSVNTWGPDAKNLHCEQAFPASFKKDIRIGLVCTNTLPAKTKKWIRVGSRVRGINTGLVNFKACNHYPLAL